MSRELTSLSISYSFSFEMGGKSTGGGQVQASVGM